MSRFLLRNKMMSNVSCRYLKQQNNGLFEVDKDLKELVKLQKDENGQMRQTFIFPKDYQPHSFNYVSNGLFLGMFIMTCFAYIHYEQDWLAETGQTERNKSKKYYYI